MEAGSLLQEALSRQAEKHTDDSYYYFSDQALYIDIYLLSDHSNSNIKNGTEHLLELAQVARHVNQFFQSTAQHFNHDWHIGGDGPVFGIHASDGIPHLRAICRYGAQVCDEWMAIHMILEYSKQDQTSSSSPLFPLLAVECWDVQDGQVLLIESANVLPSWVDSIGPEACRHRCWIHQGMIQLIAPPKDSAATNHPLGLRDALDCMRRQEERTYNYVVETPGPVQQAIHDCVIRYVPNIDAASVQSQNSSSKSQMMSASPKHKAAIAVPRSVAFLIEKRPDLVNAAIVAFANHALNGLMDTNLDKKTKPSSSASNRSTNNNKNSVVCEDWVWTTHAFTRTNYAMLRTIVSPTWKTENHVPKEYQSVELRRVQRQCAVEATPHLRHAVQVGVRLVAGFDQLLLQQQQPKPQHSSVSSHERRILHYWPRLLQEDLGLSAHWLMEAFQAGPNHAAYDLDNILHCPVVADELESQPNNVTCVSHPEVSLADQIRKELRRAETFVSSSSQTDFVMPRQDEVDANEEWMMLSSDTVEDQMQSLRGESSEKKSAKTSNKSQNDFEEQQISQLDTMLDTFQTFMASKSGAQGISNIEAAKEDENRTKANADKSDDKDNLREVKINPRVFLNLLLAALDPSTSPETINFRTSRATDHDDEFFSNEDYDAMLPDDEGDDDDDDENLPPLDTDVVELMAAMDDELKRTACGARHTADTTDTFGFHDSSGETEEVQFVTNLLQSLDAGAGGSGPVHSMMKAMGKEPPLISPEGDSSGGEENEGDF